MLFGHFSTGAVFPINSIEGDMRVLVFTLWSEEFSRVCVHWLVYLNVNSTFPPAVTLIYRNDLDSDQ